MNYAKFITSFYVEDNRNEISEKIKHLYPVTSKVHIIYSFPNQYGASVIHGRGAYGVELAVLYKDRLTYDTPVTDDVIGYIENQEELENLLSQIYNLPKQEVIV